MRVGDGARLGIGMQVSVRDLVTLLPEVVNSGPLPNMSYNRKLHFQANARVPHTNTIPLLPQTTCDPPSQNHFTASFTALTLRGAHDEIEGPTVCQK